MKPTINAIFRPYSSSDALRSDRSAGDRQRHRQKVREAVRENIADLIAEESIIGKNKDRVIKVPIRGVKEYRFIYGENSSGVGQGDGNSEKGQVIGKTDGTGQGQGEDKAGDQPGVDYYETDVTLEELVEISNSPDMERKILREVMSDRISKRKGFRNVRAGIRASVFGWIKNGPSNRVLNAAWPPPDRTAIQRMRSNASPFAKRISSIATWSKMSARSPTPRSCASWIPRGLWTP